MDLREARAAGETTRRHPWEQARVAVVERLLRAPGQPAPRVVLYVGCGDAFVASTLAAAFPGARCAGVDTAFDPGELARLRGTLATPRVSLHRTLDEAAAALGAQAGRHGAAARRARARR
jgi:trans-aconitate methyltransferase